MTTTLIICIAIIIIAFLGIIVGWAVSDIKAERMKTDCLRPMCPQDRHKIITINVKESIPMHLLTSERDFIDKVLARQIANEIVSDIQRYMTVARRDNYTKNEAVFYAFLKVVSPEGED